MGRVKYSHIKNSENNKDQKRKIEIAVQDHKNNRNNLLYSYSLKIKIQAILVTIQGTISYT
jgi:hypothetical protein